MSLIGIMGSPRKEGTFYMVKTVLEASGKPYEIINLYEQKIQQCCGEGHCLRTNICYNNDMSELSAKLANAEGIVLGSPTYFSNVSGLMKKFMDRCLPFYFSEKMKGKKVAIVTVANFKELLEFDSEGKCKWHTEEVESATRCIQAMADFSTHLGMDIIGSVYAIHEDPKSVESQLRELGKKFQ